ncbi:MAG TPA: DUF4157 domain-containing protein [Steroidobacteraceae bacterium]|nr:DUF4157 domain-containing protein [Steroidobacteraceae bacterium]
MEHTLDISKATQRSPAHTRGHAPSAAESAQHPVLSLQQQAGNQATQALLHSAGVRTRLAISQPDDPEELEAETTANSVMRAHDPSTAGGGCSCSGDDDDMCDECMQARGKRTAPSTARTSVHRSASGSAPISSLPPSIQHAVRSPGQPLDLASRSFFEPRFDHDFSSVRIHTDHAAAASATSIQAHAYTLGSDIVFAPGRHSPATTAGRTLIAHELTHVVQATRGTLATPPEAKPPEAGPPRPKHNARSTHREPQRHTSPRIHRDAAPPVDAGAVTTAVDIIVKALKGITTASDSATILQQFQGKSPDFIRAIMRDLKSRASDNDETADGMIVWLFGDMTASDRRDLRMLLLANKVLEDLGPILVNEISVVLSGILSDGTPVLEILTALGGPDLDGILILLEAKKKKTADDTGVYLFDNIDRVSASKLRDHFIQKGGPRSWVYVASWTAFKVANLIGGFLGIVSHSESTMVLNNFTDIQVVGLRQLTQQKLDQRTRGSDLGPAEDRLMNKLDQSDYEKLQQLPGLTLRKYDLKPSALDAVASGAKWALMVAEWTTCGMIGLATGLLSAGLDILKGLLDSFIAVKHLFGCLVYLLSGGSVGSEDLLATKDFFAGLGKIVSDPRKVWDQLWGQLKAEFTTIEGPLADCKRAEFVVRKLIGVVVNIVLIAVGGYGIAKAATEAGVAFAELAEEVGIIRALGQTAAKAGRAFIKFVRALPGQVAEVVEALKNPLKLLLEVRKQFNTILLAVDNEGVYAVLRERAAGLLENERAFWKENRQRWKSIGTSGQGAQTAAEEQAGLIQLAADQEQVPENKGVIADVEAKATDAKKQAADLEGEMKSNPDSAPADPQTTAKPGDFTPDQINAANKSLEDRIADPKNVRAGRSGSGYDLEVDLGDGQTYKRKFDGTWCLSRNPVDCGHIVDPKIAQAADAAKVRLDTDELIDAAIEIKERQSGGTFTQEQINTLRAQYKANPNLILDVLEHEGTTRPAFGKEDNPVDPNVQTGRGGSASPELGKLGKDFSRQAAINTHGERWIADELAFTVTGPGGNPVTFVADIGTISPQGGVLVEAKLGPGAGLEIPQEIGYPIVSTQGAVPANTQAQTFARALNPNWQPGQPIPPVRVRIEYWNFNGTLRAPVQNLPAAR